MAKRTDIVAYVRIDDDSEPLQWQREIPPAGIHNWRSLVYRDELVDAHELLDAAQVLLAEVSQNRLTGSSTRHAAGELAKRIRKLKRAEKGDFDGQTDDRS
jgi:hypothetical protein